jgi:MFS family permease
MATPELRGILTTMFQVMIAVGGTAAFLVNFGTGNITPYGWRLSLGLAFVPALFITLGSLWMPDSPSSLLQRRRPDEALRVLRRIRGTPDVGAEFESLVDAAEATRHTVPWRDILRRPYRPQLVMAICIPFFQQVLQSIEQLIDGSMDPSMD